MFGIGHSWVLLILVLAIVLIIFGPGKLSQLGGAIGRAINEFRKTQAENPTPPPPADSKDRSGKV